MIAIAILGEDLLTQLNKSVLVEEREEFGKGDRFGLIGFLYQLLDVLLRGKLQVFERRDIRMLL